MVQEKKALITILFDKQIAFHDAALEKLTGDPIGLDSGQCQKGAPQEINPHLTLPTLSSYLLIRLAVRLTLDFRTFLHARDVSDSDVDRYVSFVIRQDRTPMCYKCSYLLSD
ncbi:hypothetical protein Y032_0009g495 [Ancylostoma ceylanicum]|uniref:Uncharacterized protein n=1 Tax=Ancylostoma ceylanicum TaxID=53326 RepID=A0A016VJ83_9BILA|nr:hypothetical protein Y032_0009g495 [Ancylostoma ceylanicum]